MHVNLLGIVNLISVSNLLDQCEFIADAGMGSPSISASWDGAAGGGF
jgi:hypothetical protein